MKIKPSDILYEDNHLIAVCKPAGVLSQGDQTGDECIGDLIKDYIKEKYNKPGNVYLANLHRLDRPVSGILLCSKTSKAATRMSKAFQKNEIQKTYWAITDKKPKEQHHQLVSFLQKNPSTNMVRSFTKPRDGAKEAITDWSIIDQSKGLFLRKLAPKTGRSHQLRVHCATLLDSPILGDVKYGSTKKTSDRSLCLLAKKIEFTHPVSKEQLSIVCPTPPTSPWRLFSEKEQTDF